MEIGIENIIKNCDLCPLKGGDYALSRIHKGDSHQQLFWGPKVMFIGEAPGEEEAKQHLAFVGRSGKKLDEWIAYLELDNYVISNVVKHRPPNNRVPTESEIKSCVPYLTSELENEAPEFVIGLGQTAIDNSFNSPFLITKAITKYIEHPSYMFADNTCRILALFHPSYVLRNHNDLEVQRYLDRIKQIIWEY